MVFDARKLAESASWAPFPFIGLDGKEYVLPNVASMTGAQTARFNRGDATVMEEIADPEAYAALQALPNGIAEQLASEWLNHGAAGKERSPSSTRPRRAKRSR